MAKTIVSPVKRYPGTVTIHQPATWPQYMAWRQAVEAASNGESLSVAEASFDDASTQAMIPGVLAMVEKWDLENFPRDVTAATFPATPRVSIGRLLAWVISEVTKVIAEDDEYPN